MSIVRQLTCVCILGAFAGVARGESMEDVKKKIHEKVSGYKTLQFKNLTKTDVSTEVIRMKSETTQHVQCSKQDKKVLSRIENKSKGENKYGGQVQPIDVSTLSVCDGDYVYTLSEGMGQKSATRQKVDKSNMFNPFDMLTNLQQLEQTHTLKLVGDETVDGKPCWVVEMAMKNFQSGSGMSKRTLSYYDKSNGISLKSLTYDENGKVTTTSVTSDIKIDESIPQDRYVFKAPPGVEVVDPSELYKKGG